MSIAVGEVVGVGGSATVYRALEPGLAIKVAHDATPSTRARFEREAHALSIVGAPFVPSLVDAGTLDDGRPYLVMELVAGETLAARLAATPALTLREACAIALQILDVLAAVRSHGLAHRDLKPENIIIAADGSVRLIDFGLTRACDDDVLLTRAGTIIGTPEYMAPEQFRGSPADLPVDIYAFGVVLHELLTGRPPFVGDRAAIEHGHLHLRPTCPSLLRPMPESLEKIVLACLAKEPERRPADLGGLRDALERADERPSDSSITPRVAIKMDGARPVVLLMVAGVDTAELAELVEKRQARVARQRGDETVLVFLGSEHERPLEVALAFAFEATTRWSARGVVHVGRALVRQSRGRVALYGRDIERPADWAPEADWHGVVVTPRAAEALGLPATGEAFIPAPAIAARERSERPLVGRDRELATIESTVTHAFRTSQPRCCVVVGEDGMGKSAIAHAAKRITAETIVLTCERPVGGDTEQALRELLRFALRIETDAEPADVVRALGTNIACTDGVLAALGCNDTPLAATAFRDQVRRAILAGLKRRAAVSPLVVIVDDAHFADDLTLEILERACELEDVALAVVMTCAPRFSLANRAWEQRHTVVALQPLDEPDTATLARHLLPAGTRVSAATLQRLAQWCGGNPGVLTQLIGVLARERIIRRHEGTSSWFVAADELDRMPASPAAEWLASRELDALSAELADFARICALLGSDLSLDELEAVQRGLETSGYDRPMLDAAAGLSMLVEHGLVVEGTAGRFSFRQRAVQEALYALVPETTRAAVHGSAYEYWCSGPDSDATLFRRAHHGARGGRATEACAHYATLAARAKSHHAYDEAERMLTAAIELCNSSAVLYDCLEARGNVRRLLTHYEGARRDFERARGLAESLGDPTKLIAVLVAEAAVCDFTQEWDAQARLMVAAQAVHHADLPAPVEARYRNWLGVARARQGLSDEAIDLLRDARELGASIGDHETQVGSGLLLGYLLVMRGERAAGFTILQDTIDRCERVGDWFHLVIGLNNRIILSKLTDSQGQAEADCQRAIAISHEHGFHQLEMWGLHNLSLTRWWRGRFAGALHAAKLAYELSVERFGSKSSHRERLHYVMHLVAHGRGEEVGALLDGLREQEFESSPIDCANLAAIRLALRGASEREWREVIVRTREVGDDCDFIEVLWLRARAALQWGERIHARQALREAHDHAAKCGAPIAAVLMSELRALATRSMQNANEVPAH